MKDRDEGKVPGNDQDGETRPGVVAGVVAGFEAGAATARNSSVEDRRQLADELCRLALASLMVDGVGVSVHLGADVTVPVGASDPTAARAEALQFTVREGPCLRAYAIRRPMLVPDIDDPRMQDLWPTYSAELVHHTGFRAVHAFPLIHGTRLLGSFSVYRRRPGPAPEPVGITAAVAAIVGQHLLMAEVFAHGGADDLADSWIAGPTAKRRQQVWIAQGMTMTANGLRPAEALDLLRAHAYTARSLLDDLAEEITTRQRPIPRMGDDG